MDWDRILLDPVDASRSWLGCVAGACPYSLSLGYCTVLLGTLQPAHCGLSLVGWDCAFNNDFWVCCVVIFGLIGSGSCV